MNKDKRLKFGDFNVEWQLFDYRKGEDTGLYEVYLPHQCDSWDIAYGNSKKDVINRFQEFINDAQKALQALKDIDV